MSKTYDYKKIYTIMLNLLIKIGVSKEDAIIISKCYIEADLAGVNTHGTNIFPSHFQKFIKGVYNKAPKFNIIREGLSFCVIDGDESIGPVSAYKAMQLAIEKAKETGIFTCFLKNTNTIGPAFFYNSQALENKMIGIVISNSPPAMAPTNGKEKLLGTNPLAISIPAEEENPIIYDIATSAVAKSKIKQALVEGKQIPDGWAIDKNGKITNNAEDALNGLVLPMAGYKGYGLAMCIDILSGLISGGNYLNQVGKFYNNDTCMGVGATFIAINPEKILGQEFYKEVDNYVRTIKNSDKIDEKVMIQVPGENRIKNREKAINEGIELNENTINKLQYYLEEYQINEEL